LCTDKIKKEEEKGKYIKLKRGKREREKMLLTVETKTPHTTKKGYYII